MTARVLSGHRLASALAAALVLAGCATPALQSGPSSDAQNAVQTGAAYGEYLQEHWTSDSFVVAQRSTFGMAQQQAQSAARLDPVRAMQPRRTVPRPL